MWLRLLWDLRDIIFYLSWYEYRQLPSRIAIRADRFCSACRTGEKRIRHFKNLFTSEWIVCTYCSNAGCTGPEKDFPKYYWCGNTFLSANDFMSKIILTAWKEEPLDAA